MVNKLEEDWLASIKDDPENNIISYLDEVKKEFAKNKVIEG